MKASLSFTYDTENAEECNEIEVIHRAKDLKNVIVEFSYFLRNKIKYDQTISEDGLKILEEIREEFYKEIESRNLNIFD